MAAVRMTAGRHRRDARVPFPADIELRVRGITQQTLEAFDNRAGPAIVGAQALAAGGGRSGETAAVLPDRMMPVPDGSARGRKTPSWVADRTAIE